MSQGLVGLFAGLFLIQILFAFTGLPGWMLRSVLPEKEHSQPIPPRFVITLGGGGIPSETGLIRCYYAAGLGLLYSNHWPTFVVSLPAEGQPLTNSVGRMRDELILRGIPSNHVVMEYRALNTHEQAVNIAALLGASALDQPTIIVTSPFHLKRAILCFRKAGFTRIVGAAAENISAEADPGQHVILRYGLWANLHAEVEWARERIALLYYRIKGWV